MQKKNCDEWYKKFHLKNSQSSVVKEIRVIHIFHEKSLSIAAQAKNFSRKKV